MPRVRFTVEFHAEWEPYDEPVYGPWEGDDDTGGFPEIGRRTGARIPVTLANPHPCTVFGVSVDGEPTRGGAVNLARGNTFALERVL
jgi:hypothetical protein